ncbi:MAG: hypothetical protein WC554_06640 [Clostridia bacterium]
MASKNQLLSKGGLVGKVEILETPLDQLPDVAYPTWMKHERLDSILVNSKKEYYEAIELGYVPTDRQWVKK